MTTQQDAILEIIETMSTKSANVNPTEIYNEGWMTRLLVYYSIQENLKLDNIDFGQIDYWTSEALISSPFVFATTVREGYTHADMALGDFTVDYEVSGEIKVNPNANIFGIIEAKMGSNLSQGTSNAKDYNQASRNLACIASQPISVDCNTFFAVVAPESRIGGHHIRKQVNKKFMIEQINNRFAQYSANDKARENKDEIIRKAEKCKVWVMSYEDWIKSLKNTESINLLNEFYKHCRTYNKIK